MNKNVLRDLSYGVYIVGVNNDYLSGCVANSAMQITSSPATIAISLNHQNYTNEVIKKTKKFSSDSIWKFLMFVLYNICWDGGMVYTEHLKCSGQ